MLCRWWYQSQAVCSSTCQHQHPLCLLSSADVRLSYALVVCVACNCQVLSNSYAFAYFFFGGELFSGEFTADENQVNQNLFEDSQEQLAVEVRL